MTRTELLNIANSVTKKPLEVYADKEAYIFTGLYKKRPISVFVDEHKQILAVSFNRVCYFTTPTDRRVAGRLRTFKHDHCCSTSVFLYPEAKCLYRDAEGCNESTVDKAVSNHLDYSDVIPVQYHA